MIIETNFKNVILRYSVLILIYGTFYTLCEIIWKGGFDKLHWSMFILAAFGGLITGWLNNIFNYEIDIILQCLIGGIIVTCGEGLIGNLINIEYLYWDYRSLPLSFWNAQINLFFSLIWSFVLCPIAIFIDDIFDYYVFKSGEKPYYKLCGKVLFYMP